MSKSNVVKVGIRVAKNSQGRVQNYEIYDHAKAGDFIEDFSTSGMGLAKLHARNIVDKWNITAGYEKFVSQWRN